MKKKWSDKYKKSINCDNPKGFSQKAHCQGRKKKVSEAVMTAVQKRRDTNLKKKYDDSDMKKNMIRQYGKEEGIKVYYATIRKQAMKESMEEKRFCQLCGKDEFKEECSYGPKMWEMFTLKNFNKSIIHPANSAYEEVEHSNWREEIINEEGLRAWFGKSKSKGGKPGWVQVVSGKPCARQPGQKSTPKCVSSAKRASMTEKERKSAQRRKRAADPNQPNKTGAAKPTYVSTDKKKKSVKEAYLRVQERGRTYTILLNWRGKTLNVQMFFPNFIRPSKDEVVKEIRKVYPNAIVLTFNPVFRDPTLPLLFAGGKNEPRRYQT